ncbi:MAG: DNA methyltransferase, partial [bacterium]|nr:DNA methyltransferase [bacterium]
AELRFETVLDAFGGTGAVAHLMKAAGKEVTFNDLLACNHQVGLALIENDGTRLSSNDVDRIVRPDPANEYDDFIARTFADIYFTDEENRWLDVVVQNIGRLRHRYRRALAYYALFQSCIAKRPYNLFHRKNLYMRTARVRRGFGNKTTWDRPFEEHFRRHVEQANAAVFDFGSPCRALQHDAAAVPGRFDLVYIDPPYVSARNVGVDYHGFYHFLEGSMDYSGWASRIDYGSKHRRLEPVPSPWTRGETNLEAFRRVFERYAESILVVSYRSDGLPTAQQLADLLGEFSASVRMVCRDRYQYALSTNRKSQEVLLIGE